MRLSKIILIASSLFSISFSFDNNITFPILEGNSSNVKNLKDKINQNTKNIVINRAQILENSKLIKKNSEKIDEISKKSEKMKKLLNQAQSTLSQINKIKEENVLLKRAIAKMILDIEKMKKFNKNLYVITGKAVNVRSCPSTVCDIVRVRYKGDLVVVKDKLGDWYETNDGNYIYSKFLKRAY